MPIELWNEIILKHIISPIGNLIGKDHKSEEVSKGLFVRICVEVDVSKPLKRKLKYFYEVNIHECLLEYANMSMKETSMNAYKSVLDVAANLKNLMLVH